MLGPQDLWPAKRMMKTCGHCEAKKKKKGTQNFCLKKN
jgi:hypothetical protein